VTDAACTQHPAPQAHRPDTRSHPSRLGPVASPGPARCSLPPRLTCAPAQLAELVRHAAAQPECVNGWRRLAEFRMAAAHDAPRDPAADAHRPGQHGGPAGDDEDREQRVEKLGPAELVGEWLRLDPVCRAGLDALEALVRAGHARRRQLVESLAAALDCGPDPALHAELLRHVSAADGATLRADAQLWADRRAWWPALHGPDWCRGLWGE
jgi:hypothetical protein